MIPYNRLVFTKNNLMFYLNHSSSQNSSQSEKSIWEPGPSLIKAEYKRWNSAPNATPCRAETHCWSSDACWIELNCINIDHSWTDLKNVRIIYIFFILTLKKVLKISSFLLLKILIFSGNQLENEYWTRILLIWLRLSKITFTCLSFFII